MNIRTDLAVEAREMYVGKEKEVSGISVKENKKGDILITEVEISDESSSKKINKPIGKYTTIESESFKMLSPEFLNESSYVLKDELEKLKEDKEYNNVLIVGLGNAGITSDSLGPRVVSKIMVTRHIKEYMPMHLDSDIIPVSAVSPGVLGITGIETNDIISAITRKLNPDLIIVIDALASSSPKRISTTIQITDTGINPGSGVSNNRKEISKKSLNTPVIAIGVPTVVDLLSIAKFIYPNIEKTEIGKDFFVTPKEIDKLIENMSKIIANGINLSLHKNIDLEYIEAFINWLLKLTMI